MTRVGLVTVGRDVILVAVKWGLGVAGSRAGR